MDNTIFDFKKADCKNCYKCLRNCPVKAIQFKKGQAKVIASRCILCGNCINICPQNAKKVKNDISYFKNILKNNKVAVSLAPSFTRFFDKNSFISKLSKSGVDIIEETSIGAYFASEKLSEYCKDGSMENIITNACYSVVKYIKQHKPEFIKYIPNIPSPMSLHARLIKRKYGNDTKVVFIGPCLAKKEEGLNEEAVDIVITFEEIEKFIENINSCEIDNQEKYYHRLITRCYPEPGGLIKSTDLKESKYNAFAIDGVESFMEVFEDLDKEKGLLLEVLACENGCLAGPCISKEKRRLIEYRKVCESGYNKEIISEYEKILNDEIYKVNYNNEKVYEVLPKEEEIRKVLKKVGKYNKDQELNCGACGYRTCREKAIAVIENRAELEMCLPYMQKRAKSISDKILKFSPNAIIALNNELEIIELNNSARKLLEWETTIFEDKDISEFIEASQIIECIEYSKSRFDREVYIKSLSKWVERTIVVVEDQEMVLIFMKDITKTKLQEQEIGKVKLETIKTADNVINKQMRVAQEIASLLGETTAESKLALIKLRESLLEDRM